MEGEWVGWIMAIVGMGEVKGNLRSHSPTKTCYFGHVFGGKWGSNIETRPKRRVSMFGADPSLRRWKGNQNRAQTGTVLVVRKED